jgi:exopolyphosphatase/guanosine-5'-triphosphate,3'-diphosphate pyrophosphatase
VLGVPIDVIAGREEARLIYLGVAHSMPMTRERRMVVDIGGGSTEFIIGSGLKPLKLESLYMGCVSWSLRYFPDGKIGKAALKQAELAARTELQTMARKFRRKHWSEAVASSGTARSIAEVLQSNGLGDGTITPQGLNELRALLLKAGDVEKLELAGLRGDRVSVLPGGFAIMSAILHELEVDSIAIANGALRQGLLWDLLGRVHHHDMRDVTAKQLMRRYHVDPAQAKRVSRLATRLLASIVDSDSLEAAQQFVVWAAGLHEIGITVAYTGYHRHSAYILRNADMPGFSRMEQERLALLVAAHRGQLRKLDEIAIADDDWPLVAALRLAALFHRSRTEATLPDLALKRRNDTFVLDVPHGWLAENPLTETALREEAKLWRGSGRLLEVRLTGAEDTSPVLSNAA